VISWRRRTGSLDLFGPARPGRATRKRLLGHAGLCPGAGQPKAVRVDGRWRREGVDGERVSWSVGYGPRTEAWVLRPAGVRGPLPGALALHDHGGFKYFGKEKIADGPAGPGRAVQAFRAGGLWRACLGHALAREGWTVLVPDVFSVGQPGKFPLAP